MLEMKSKAKIQTLKLNIEEQRRKYDEVCGNYASIKNRILTFLAGSLAFLAYLYGSGELFVPQETYGQIFYWLGFLLYIIAIIILFMAVQPVVWHLPTDTVNVDKLKVNTEEEYLEYVQNEYIECININKQYNEQKYRLLDMALKLLIIGGIVLVIIKNFNIKSSIYVPYERYNNQRILK